MSSEFRSCTQQFLAETTRRHIIIMTHHHHDMTHLALYFVDHCNIQMPSKQFNPDACARLWLPAGGGVYGLFLPAFQIAATDPFKLLPPGTPPLTVWTTNFWFSVGFAATSIILNGIFLYKPPFGTQASSVTCYLKDNRGRGLSVLSGALAAAGDLSQFMGGQVAGYAACMLVGARDVYWGVERVGCMLTGIHALLQHEYKLVAYVCAACMLVRACGVCWGAARDVLAACWLVSMPGCSMGAS